jgi:MFS family permease
MSFEQKTVLALYKKLLVLYPQDFKEQFGESMRQTFNDLCNDHKRELHKIPLGLVIWMFTETSVGIIKEHFFQIKRGKYMGNIMTNFKQAAIIGLLIILPFMILNFIFDIVKRLDTYSFRNVLDVVVIFGLLWLGLTAIAFILMPIVRNLRTGSKIIENPIIHNENLITKLLTKPKSAAIISFIFALPFLSMLSLLLLRIEPPFAHLLSSNPDQPNFPGLFVVLGALLLVAAAGVIARVPVVRTMQAGGSLFAHPVNLIMATVILSFITMLVAGLMIDQYPCWIGVPNCD